MRIDDACLKPSANNLTLTRLILASAVIYTHSYGHFTHIDRDDLTWLLGSPVSHHAVDGFFFLAGFLVYRSIVQNPSVPRFLLARVTRLLPGLALMIALTVAVGAFVTEMSFLNYATGSETLKFIFFNLSLAWPAYNLTGITCDGQPCLINGSLWTLPWEARCYAALTILALCGFARRDRMVPFILPLTAAAAIGWAVAGALFDLEAILPSDIFYYLATTLRFWPAFALGIFVYEFRKNIPLSWPLLGLILALDVAVQNFAPSFGMVARLILISYLVLCLGFLSARSQALSAAWPDYSYGIYIYGFPAMLVALAVFPITDPYLLTLITLILVIPCAALSWHLVEKPALDWLRRKRARARNKGPADAIGGDPHPVRDDETADLLAATTVTASRSRR